MGGRAPPPKKKENETEKQLNQIQAYPKMAIQFRILDTSVQMKISKSITRAITKTSTEAAKMCGTTAV